VFSEHKNAGLKFQPRPIILYGLTYYVVVKKRCDNNRLLTVDKYIIKFMTNELEDWRGRINELDRQLVQILEKRFAIVEKIADYKRVHGLPVRDEKREAELVNMISQNTKLNPHFISDLYEAIFANSYLIEQ